MRRILKESESRHIRACKEYIYAHIKERITVEDLAQALGVSPSYLSRLFKKETGESVSAYIRERKIAVAENLLKYTDHSMIEIANLLSFSSESHFIQQFREVGGYDAQKVPGRKLPHPVGWRTEINCFRRALSPTEAFC